ncbi:hypothetical protein G6L32_05585 [Agrobacterium tumefaciens]|uniref:hypothetical protein n=1 Tax=Agrobacterium tumefaciens TaxID=358 RepID=UPI0015726238|nr:hypothetical protein [Agrobacterium tumefaciens]
MVDITAAEVFRDFVTDGVPSSGPHNPRKPDIRKLLKQFETIIAAFMSNGGVIYASKAALDADLTRSANTMAWVLGDAVAANNGIYRKVGAPGAGNWVRAGDLPYSFILASNIGAGTPSAIHATTSIPVSGSTLILLQVAEDYAGEAATVSFNGDSALAIKTNSGADVRNLAGGSVVYGVISGGVFRLANDEAIASLIYQARDEAVAAEGGAQLAQDAAEAARDIAAGYASDVVSQGAVPIYATVVGMPSLEVPVGINAIRVNGYYVAGDGGGALYAKADSEPSHAGKFQTIDGAWWELRDLVLTPQMFGAKGDGAHDDTAAFIAMCAQERVNCIVPATGGKYLITGYVRIRRGLRMQLASTARIYTDNPQGGCFVNGIPGDANYATGYDGDGDLDISGGEFEMNVSRPVGSSQGAYFQIAHADNVSITHAKVINCYRGHPFEINSTRNWKVEWSTFEGQFLESGDGGRDAVNIDSATLEGFPLFGAWDGTACENFSFSHNYVDGYQSPGASHGYIAGAQKHKCGVLGYNTMKNMTQYGIRLFGWRDSRVIGNLVEGAMFHGARFQACEDIFADYNTLLNVGQGGAGNAVQFDADRNSVWGPNNRISNAEAPVNFGYAFRIFDDCVGTKITTGKTTLGATGNGLISDTSNKCIINGAFVRQIADDNVVVVPAPVGSTQGTVEIVAHTSAAPAPRGLWWYRISASPAMLKIAADASSTTAIRAGGGALTGTTGTDGLFTLSVDAAGNLYVENRSGVSVQVDIRFSTHTVN